jgi:putative transposase
MKLKTRTVEIVGITSEPDGAWMTQLARNLTDPSDGFLRGVQYVIFDRDPLSTAVFRRLLRESGVKPLVLPAWSPNLNAFAERFVGSAKVRVPEANGAPRRTAPPGGRTRICPPLS